MKLQDAITSLTDATEKLARAAAELATLPIAANAVPFIQQLEIARELHNKALMQYARAVTGQDLKE